MKPITSIVMAATAMTAPGIAFAQAPEQTLATQEETADSIASLYDELDEFVITARKEVIKSDGARLTYDLEQDDTSKGQSLLDA
ncbi:MAG: hypothetical protein K2L59_06160, partial [Muribaculaceae bacterium]|nr:hypothetical protein [Muribaculaceae bacterium]